MPSRTTHRARIASHVPGRLRVKLTPGRSTAGILAQIKADLEARQGIHGVAVNATTGSLTVEYDPQRHTSAGILGLLEDLDVLVESLTHTGLGSGGATLTVGEAIDDLNARLSRFAHLPIDLRAVLPLGFVGLGVWSILRNGLLLDQVPGWLLVWAGIDLFVKTRPHDVVRKTSAVADEPGE
ncbi:HMA2 domain-containing protein [Candidatus Methylocalor cossyra]|uniref:HMA domain-containing protein n=1 Tax=Candidatus Methylocalor cossyra TaxID=3108543 RepID=A0ABM9NMA2_9GAMM